MKKSILCRNCGMSRKKNGFPPSKGDKVMLKKGFSIRETTCLRCSETIKKGEILYCMSEWSDKKGIPYESWEHDYIVS